MSQDIISIIILSLIVIFELAGLIYMAACYYWKQSERNYTNKRSSYIDRKTSMIDQKEYIQKLKTEKEILSYTNEFIQFLKEYVAQVSVIKFRTFIDTHDIDKSTNQQYQRIVKETAEEVKLNLTKIDLSILLISEKAIDKMIVDYSVIYIKDLIDKNFGEEPPFDI